VSNEDHKVNVPEGVSGCWSITRFSVSKSQYLMTGITLRTRAVIPGDYTRLKRGGTVVMSDTPADVRDHNELFSRARDTVQYNRQATNYTTTALIHGLGLGMALKAILDYGIQHVTVVENSEDVIKLVAQHYLDDYPGRITIIHDDARTWKPKRGAHWDLVWHDIWDNITSDNLSEMRAFHRRFGRRSNWQGSWARSACERQRRENRKNFGSRD